MRIWKQKDCDICGEKIDLHRDSNGDVYWADGHNAKPVADGRCCDTCNATVVIPTRISRMMRR